MFRTDLHMAPYKDKIALNTPVLSTGSCFSTCIGEKLANNKFTTLVNPFGTVFNPVSLFKQLAYTIENKLPDEASYLEKNGLFRHYDFHSTFHGSSKEALVTRVRSALTETRNFLRSAEWIALTLGTAFVYTLNSSRQVVSNCHKMPAPHFTRRLLTLEEIVSGFNHLHASVKAIRPGIKFILTVSPVRHIKDTITANSVSKATLRMACHELVEQFDDVDYFPSFELMMDDLRDYRFYKADMLHPTEVAENYIWEKFSQRYFDPETVLFLQQWQKIRKAMLHKPFNPGSPAHQQFVSETIHQLKDLSRKIDVRTEIELLKKQLL